MANILRLTWADICQQASKVADRNAGRALSNVYGIPTGGAPVAVLVAERMGLPLVEEPQAGRTLVVDDLVDTGTTMARYARQGFHCDALYRKPISPTDLAPDATLVDGWLTFPWEKDDGDPTDAVLRLLQHIGEDPTRDGLRDTPRRVVKALRELTNGYRLNAAEVLGTTFDVTHDEMIVVRDLPFSSLCEHHMLPFTGTATVAYIPAEGGRIVGLSKIARLVDMYARRLQVQERMTDEIAEALETHLQTRGVAVLIQARHTCMSMRGIGKHGEMLTSRLTGFFRDDHAARNEFLLLNRP
jgi:GTP cyclohydrolase I